MWMCNAPTFSSPYGKVCIPSRNMFLLFSYLALAGFFARMPNHLTNPFSSRPDLQTSVLVPLARLPIPT